MTNQTNITKARQREYKAKGSIPKCTKFDECKKKGKGSTVCLKAKCDCYEKPTR